MKELLKNEIITVSYDENTSLLVLAFKTATYINEAEFFRYMELFIPFLDKYKPQKVLIDTKDTMFPLTDEVIDWILSNITPKFKENNVKRIAYVLPQDILTRTGLEFFIERLFTSAPELNRMVFDDADKAIAWLNK